jgi:hypothetical protein
MNKSNLLKTLEERPLRMASERNLRPQTAFRFTTAPATARKSSDTPLPAFLILALAFSLVYAVMRTMPV